LKTTGVSLADGMRYNLMESVRGKVMLLNLIQFTSNTTGFRTSNFMNGISILC